MPVPVTDIGTELLFENEVVRVWSMTLEPGQAFPYHEHRLDYLYVYVTPSRIAFMETPGRVTEVRDYADGYVSYVSVGEGITHQIRNDARIPHRQILVELKTIHGAAPSGSNSRVSAPVEEEDRHL
jgi:beta-alanine degradation protein BauB